MSKNEPKNEPKKAQQYDIEFYWDPVCPFAWMTSRWIHKVKETREVNVDWKFISLREINKGSDYSGFPEGYANTHIAGLKMLRVAAAVRRELGRDPMEDLYTAFGESVWNRPPPASAPDSGSPNLAGYMQGIGEKEQITACLEKAGLPASYADAAENSDFDEEIAKESAEALSRTGEDVGTPILTWNPPDGPSLFGPVISQVPESSEEAARYFDAFQTLLEWESFAELKRSLRQTPRLPLLEGYEG